MDKIVCFICKEGYSGIKAFTFHFGLKHGMLVSRSSSGFYCKQVDCGKHFLKYDSFMRHLKVAHKFQNDSNKIVHCNKKQIEDVHVNLNSEIVNFSPSTSSSHHTGDENLEREVDINVSASRMIANLKADSSFTGANLLRVANAAQFFVSDLSYHAENEILRFVKEKNIPEDDPDLIKLLQKINYNSLFADLNSLNGQMAAFKKHFTFVQPTEIPLDYRFDERLQYDGQTWERHSTRS